MTKHLKYLGVGYLVVGLVVGAGLLLAFAPKWMLLGSMIIFFAVTISFIAWIAGVLILDGDL